MNLYLITQSENNDYDTYDSAVVAAITEDVARNTHPGAGGWEHSCHTWASSPDKVSVELIGTTDKEYCDGEIVLASFNAR
jgi:hypothetical protein